MKGLFGAVRALFAGNVLHQNAIYSQNPVAGRHRWRWRSNSWTPLAAEIGQPADILEVSLPAGGPRMTSKWDAVLPPLDFATIAPSPERRGPADFASKRNILIVEDNYLLAELVSNLVRDCGLEPVGPAGRLREGCRLAAEKALDGALLDVKLADDFCFPIASILKARGIPFIFVTGWCESSLIPREFRHVPVLPKPFENDKVRAALASILHDLDAESPPPAGARAPPPGVLSPAARSGRTISIERTGVSRIVESGPHSAPDLWSERTSEQGELP